MKLCCEGFEKDAVVLRGRAWKDTEGEEILFAEIGRGEVVRVPEEDYHG